MKIIILAAGKGARLMPLTKNTPKPLIDLGNGNTLLEEQMERIIESGVIDEVVLVVGYLVGQIEAKVGSFANKNIKIKTIYNPFYDVSNNLVSLWFAKNEMEDDFMITNGDNIFTPDVFSSFVKENGEGIFLSTSVKEKYEEFDMKITLENDLVKMVSRKIDADQIDAESPGLSLIHGEKARRIFKRQLEMLIRDEENINKFWLETFNALHDNGISVHPWEFDGKTKWQEIDFHFDLDKTRELIKTKTEHLEDLS